MDIDMVFNTGPKRKAIDVQKDRVYENL
ncbi:unnamed protein product, partial [Brachionus calyciflorus]